MLKRSLRKWAEQGIIDNHQRPVSLLCANFVRYLYHQSQIDNCCGWIGRRFGDDQFQRAFCRRFLRCGAHAVFISTVKIGCGVRSELRHDAVIQHIDAAINRAAMQDAVTGTDISKRDARMRGHPAAISDGGLRAIDCGETFFEKIETRMAKPRIDMIGRANLRPCAIEIGFVHILGMTGRRIDESRCHENRRLNRSHPRFRFIAERDRERFWPQTRFWIRWHVRQSWASI